MSHKDYFIRSAIDFAFRRKHPALALIVVGAGLLTALLAGIAFSATIPLSNGDLRFSFSMEGGGAVVTWAALTVALLLIGSGLIWLYTDWRRADRLLDDAADSPIVEDGDRWQPTVGLALAYRF